MLSRFSCFNIEIAYSNFTFCGAQTPSLCTFRWKMSKFQETKHTPGKKIVLSSTRNSTVNATFYLFIYLFIYLFQAPTPTPAAQTLSTDTREIMVTIGDVPYPISPTADAFEEIVLPESVEQDLAREPEGEPGSICEYYQVFKNSFGAGGHWSLLWCPRGVFTKG